MATARAPCQTGGVRAATGVRGAEPRLILSARVWLPAVSVVAAGSALLMPVNQRVAEDFCYGDACTDQDRLVDAAPQIYTSGIVVGYVCAYLIGSLVVGRDRWSRRARPVVAALAGLALAAVQAAVAVPYAAARLRASPLGSTADPTMLSSPGLWRAIVVSFLACPLCALVGLGVGPLLRHRARLVGATLAVPVLLAWLSLCLGTSGPIALLLIPMMAVYFLADGATGYYAAGVLLCALGGLAVLANLTAATARRSAVSRRTGT